MSSVAYNMLQLHLAQAELALDKAKNNEYSDKRKEEYHEKLALLFDAVRNEVKNTTVLTEDDIYLLHKRHIDFIFKSLEFLDSSTLNQIPYEIVECLNHAMGEWLGDTGGHIIVTSLINNINGFSFDPSLAYNDTLYKEIDSKYSISFPQRLVQINFPRVLARDYLASVVLYHELGHFVDMRFKITESLTRDLLDNIVAGRIKGVELDCVIMYLPFLKDYVGLGNPIPTQSPLFRSANYHLAEYFCDLFASQYIANSSNFYLQYVTENSTIPYSTHPATTNRIRIVNDFLDGNSNFIITLINDVVHKVADMHLTVRYEKVPGEDFYDLVPVVIDDIRQLHGILHTGWQVWLSGQEKLARSFNDQYPNPLRFYTAINNLIEKSIGNFITVNKWNRAKS